MNKQEAGKTANINKWLAAVVQQSAPWEIKHTKGKKMFALKDLEEHQKNYLLAATTKKGCTWKIPDTGYGYNPFDSFHYKNTEAYVVIVFPTWVCAIEIRVLLTHKKTAISEETARRLSKFTLQSKDLGY